MTDDPKIPFGYKRVTGRSQKGDGIWDGKRFRKVKREYPMINENQIAIRPCEIVQQVIVEQDVEEWMP